MKDLGPQRALVFRIMHRDNLSWTLSHGVQCRAYPSHNPSYVDIGNPDLIGRRDGRPVPVPPFGTLRDYVPFYFTPRSPMLLNIMTGEGGVQRRAPAEIIILVSSLHTFRERSLHFVFTDRHAYLPTATFHADLADLGVIDWHLLRRSDFKRDNDDLGKFERYQAEALVSKQVPIDALLGVVCSDDAAATAVQERLATAGIKTKVAARPRWFFQ